MKNRITQVAVVGRDELSAFEWNRLSVEPCEIGCVNRSAVCVTTGATETGEKSRTCGLGRFRRRLSAEPSRIVVGAQYDDAATHFCMLIPTVFRAVEWIHARESGLKPLRRVPSGKNILLHAKSRDIKTMDDIFRRHGELHCSTCGDMELVNLAITICVLDLPHPLPCDYIHVHAPGRGTFDFPIN